MVIWDSIFTADFQNTMYEGMIRIDILERARYDKICGTELMYTILYNRLHVKKINTDIFETLSNISPVSYIYMNTHAIDVTQELRWYTNEILKILKKALAEEKLPLYLEVFVQILHELTKQLTHQPACLKIIT